ncbi:PHP domain-like protein [Lactarius pseudohatsudake]|nr:PHP domain-like protein [Lactarius pseudohatsudake]
MYFDLNFLVPPPSRNTGPTHAQSNKGKGKQTLHSQPTWFSQAQLEAIEARIDLLVHLGYSVIAFNQSIKTKVEPKTFVNALDPLLRLVKKRPGIIYLKRLTIVLDEDSEKGFGLTNAHSNLFTPYDIIALAPTTEASFSLACLTHTQPSPLSAHIISVPLDVPRLPFRMKHTMVRTALRNGAVFEIPYASALDNIAKRNWWAAAREVVRVTKGKGLIVTGGGMDVADLRAPRDVGNLVTFLGLAQDMAHNAATITPKSLVLRAQTRKTYRAVFSEPRVVIPATSAAVPRNVVECEQSRKRPVEAILSHTEDTLRSSDGRQKKRTGDSTEPADAGHARKKKRKK